MMFSPKEATACRHTSPDVCWLPCLCCLTVLLSGFYAAAMVGHKVTSALACPVDYYCPGGIPVAAFDAGNPLSLSPSEPSIKKCPTNTTTLGGGAISVDQCRKLQPF
jgi:hypothetical protein